MILIDDALRAREAEGRPVRVGMVGAGFMARGIAWQLRRAAPGLRLVAVANRTPQNAHDVLRRAGHTDVREVDDPDRLGRVVDEGGTAVTRDPALLCAADAVDVLIEATGAVEFGARVLTAAIAHGKDVV